LLYNIPTEHFGTSNANTFVAAMNWLLTAERSNLLCASELHYLRRDSAEECWPCAQCDGFIDAAVKAWNNW
jgi:hypothetical protein